MQPHQIDLQPVYFLLDGSGSTRQSGFNAACNESLPGLVAALEKQGGTQFTLSLLSYATTAQVVLASTDLKDLQLLPHIPAGGYSGLATGLRLLGATVDQDYSHLAADRVIVRPALVVLATDGLPTDTWDDLRAAYQDCRSQADGRIGEILVVLPEGEVSSAVAGLGQGLERPDVDVVEIPVVDGNVLAQVARGMADTDAGLNR